MSFDDVCKEVIKKIRKGEIKDHNELEKDKTKIGKKYNIDKIVKNADIISYLDNFCRNNKDYKRLKKFLQTKPVRTASGVANIAVMWSNKNSNISCPGKCIYCPKGDNAPQSYTGVEPATMRAIRLNYDPYKQIQNRLKQLNITGHPTDKCELIIMGGTFLSAKNNFQDNFVKKCFDALNNKKSKTLKEAQKLNEKAVHRCVGLTIETRADYCKKNHIEQMLKLGCTRVELGVQSTDDKILKAVKRGHLSKDNIEAIKLLKQAGLKVCAHWMPGLTGLKKMDMKKELKMFRELFKNPDYRPDELKIYPTLVISGTKLYDLWKNGNYDSMTTKKMINLLIEMKRIIPGYVRIKRIMRDISHKEVAAGPSDTNIRQIANEKMRELKIKCNCIRCREIQNKKPEKVTLNKIEYTASGGREIFLSFEDKKNNLLLAFLRLRLDNDNFAKVRELHVYGPMVEIGKKSDKTQHRGYGKKLLKEAEKIAKKERKKAIQITSGIGVRNYYKKLGYRLKGFYMVKNF